MLSLLLALTLPAQTSAITWPPLGRAPPTFGATLTVDVAGVKAPPPRKPAPPQQLAEGRKLYAQRCAMCHGDTGAADGFGARRVKPDPQHLDDVIWQGAVSDAGIEKAILDGGAAVSRSPMMPANPDLKKKPALTKALGAYVRSLRAAHGSVTATDSFPAAPTSTPLTVRANAGADGRARVVIANVSKGKARIEVMTDDQGTIGCALDVDVVADTTLVCPSLTTKGTP
jgi:mono/diheme cytochrome c family protein